MRPTGLHRLHHRKPEAPDERVDRPQWRITGGRRKMVYNGIESDRRVVEMDVSKSAIAVLFDVDGTLISSGGAGAASWRMAFDDLYGIPADIGRYTDAGMTEPEVGRLTFKNLIGHEPSRRELARVMSRRLHYLPRTVAESKHFKVLPGVVETLDRLGAGGYLLGITTGGMEAAAHIKLARANLSHYFCFG